MGLRSRSLISVNICSEFSVLCLCSVEKRANRTAYFVDILNLYNALVCIDHIQFFYNHGSSPIISPIYCIFPRNFSPISIFLDFIFQIFTFMQRPPPRPRPRACGPCSNSEKIGTILERAGYSICSCQNRLLTLHE